MLRRHRCPAALRVVVCADGFVGDEGESRLGGGGRSLWEVILEVRCPVSAKFLPGSDLCAQLTSAATTVGSTGMAAGTERPPRLGPHLSQCQWRIPCCTLSVPMEGRGLASPDRGTHSRCGTGILAAALQGWTDQATLQPPGQCLALKCIFRDLGCLDR